MKPRTGPREDITGRRFGRLVVIEFSHMATKLGSYWRCQCDCGREKILQRGKLITGHTKSCGCGLVEARKKRLELRDKLLERKSRFYEAKKALEARGAVDETSSDPQRA